MIILGIDTTGFSSSISLVKDGQKVMLNHINPSYELDAGWNNVIWKLPQLHFVFFMSYFKNSFSELGVNWDDIDAIAVSAGSGIENCIKVGKSIAELYGKKYKKPIIEVDHVLAHAYSVQIENGGDFNYPVLSFSSSGSHNFTALINDRHNCQALCLKDVVDVQRDTEFHVGIGKYFFRMFNYLELNEEENGWQIFFKMMEVGDPKKYDSLNLKMKRTYEFDDRMFDFSGLMNGVASFVKKEKEKNGKLTDTQKKDLAASFQEIVSNEIANSLLFFTRLHNAKEVHLSGGISMNKCIENRVRKIIKSEFPKVKIRLPKKEYRLDNAAMIASLAFYQEKYKIKYKNFKPVITS